MLRLLLARRALRAARAATRQEAVWSMTVLAQRRRSTPARVLPLIRPLLDDSDEGVRAEVVLAFRRCGRGGGRYGDDVARVAERYPQVAERRGFTPEYRAVQTLMLLGDPRWVEVICALTCAPYENPLRDSIPIDGGVLDTVRQRLDDLAASRTDHPAVPVLANALGDWGLEAAAAVPELVAALPETPTVANGYEVLRALVRIGCDDSALVPHLRALPPAHPDDGERRRFEVEAAFALARLAGDGQPLARLVRGVMDDDEPFVIDEHHRAVWAVGRALRDVVPSAAAHLTGTLADTVGQQVRQVLAARLVWAATADAERVLPTLRAVLAGGGWPALDASRLIADLAGEGVDLGGTVPGLRSLLRDEWAWAGAVRALWRIGATPRRLSARRVVDLIASRRASLREPLSSLVEMGVGSRTLRRLERLANRDRRVFDFGIDHDIVWDDEALQERLREAVAALRLRRNIAG